MMNTNQIDKVNSLMERQLDACKAILTVVDEYEKQNLSAEDVKSAELQQLKDYTGDMLLACSTTQKLTKAISEATTQKLTKAISEAIETAKKEKAAAAKAAKKAKAEEKKVEAKPAKVTGQKEEPTETVASEKPETPETPAQVEDDDLSWLE